MTRRFKVCGILILILAFAWFLLGIWVNYSGEQKLRYVGDIEATKRALIIYNPDPIYNLDEQLSLSFAEGLS
jgi:hypothetical protein